jgi:hypothetical protein
MSYRLRQEMYGHSGDAMRLPLFLLPSSKNTTSRKAYVAFTGLDD